MGSPGVSAEEQAIMMERGAVRPTEWMCGKTCEPMVPGLYERRSHLGVTVDYFDGERWVRQTHRRVMCANQDLDWREVVH